MAPIQNQQYPWKILAYKTKQYESKYQRGSYHAETVEKITSDRQGGALTRDIVIFLFL
jgi:hypothetical protein